MYYNRYLSIFIVSISCIYTTIKKAKDTKHNMPYQADEEEKPFLANGRSTSLELESKTQTGHVDGQNRLTHRHTKLVARGIAAFLALQIILIGIYTYVYLSFAHPSQSALETVGLQLGASVEGKHISSLLIAKVQLLTFCSIDRYRWSRRSMAKEKVHSFPGQCLYQGSI